MGGHSIDFGLGVIETMVLFDPHLRYLDILLGFETCMFQHLFRTGHRAAVDSHDHLSGFGGLDHPADVASDAGQAEHPAHSVLSQSKSGQVGDLPHIRAAGAGEEQYFIRFAEAFFFHGFLSSLDHFLDLFHGGKLSGHLHGSIHHQGRRHHHTVVADGFDILDLNDFCFNADFLDRLPGSILELVALGSTHSQDFNLFHFLLLSIDSVYEIYPFP